jgi:hypothetical protein
MCFELSTWVFILLSVLIDIEPAQMNLGQLSSLTSMVFVFVIKMAIFQFAVYL